MSARSILFVALGLGALHGCDGPDKPKGTGTFEDLRVYLASNVHAEAAAWQAQEVRLEALAGAEQAGRHAAAAREVGDLLRRWEALLDEAPTPLPIRAPLATLRKALAGLADAKGEARVKALEAVDEAVADLARRKVEVAPDAAVPLADAPYLVRIWRDVTSLRALGAAPKEEGAPDLLAELRGMAEEAAATASAPGERLAHGLAVQLLATVGEYRDNPPTVDARTATLYRMGRIGREQIDEALCKSAVPMAKRIEAVERLALDVRRSCERGGCDAFAADLVVHPLMRELKSVAAKARECKAEAALSPAEPQPQEREQQQGRPADGGPAPR